MDETFYPEDDGGIKYHQVRKVPKEPETRFFLAAEPTVGEHGVIGLLICDKNPQERWEHYDHPDWTGVRLRLDPDKKANKEKYDAPLKRRRFLEH